ncbi:hypothetical protein [Marinobacter sp. AN1]|uniref:hypothetical protein n=1 Tax=Marinobacter sp. AN1 TaxID=2886046 RepID=UPI0022319CF1|nr:hypothetical protein [Marinobacter sp. AN1]UZD64053.1 hypothetical protein LJ360_10275 [Marinobacter sp. AN1]
MRERIEKANERNRANLDKTMAEFQRRLIDEANGVPMEATRENRYIYTMLEDGFRQYDSKTGVTRHLTFEEFGRIVVKHQP